MPHANAEITISPICVDLGGKYTGVLMTQGRSGEAPHLHGKCALTLIYPDTGLNLSQKDRLTKRHQRRSFKRRRLSKRLLQLILRQSYSGSEEQFFADFQRLRTFLNRRGYTYLTLEEAEQTIQNISAIDMDERHAIVAALGDDCELSPQAALLPQLEKTDKKPLQWYRKLIERCSKVRDKENKALDKDLKKSVKTIQDYCEGVVKAEAEGHKARSEYLKNIHKDFSMPEYAELAKKLSLTSSEIANLVGHIANLQLRVLRRYFNDKAMATKDYWNEKRFEKIFSRYLNSWHVTKDRPEFKNRSELLAQIQTRGVLTTFRNVNPKLSIPPFEDQNNRRPPTCKSLHLDDEKLDKLYPQWRVWLQQIIEKVGHTYELTENANVGEIVSLYEKSRNFLAHKKSKGKEAVLLQRVLDRSKLIDDFHLRHLVAIEEDLDNGEVIDPNSQKRYETGKKAVTDAIGDTAAAHWIALARKYYGEVAAAKRGLWLPEQEENLCYRCDRKPKQKSNLKDALVGHILGVDLKPNNQWVEWEKLYREPKTINGRSSLASVCKNIEETRKDMGDQFHVYWHRIQRKGFVVNASDNDEKTVLRLVDLANKVADNIAEFFKHDAQMSGRYRNPYSLAQIYNIMDAETGGFYSTCPGCTWDNFWRSSPAAVSPDGKIARAVRLSADTMRPFDGYLARYLERIALQIAKEKWQQIETLPTTSVVHIPILLEQNRFRFNADLAEMKDAARKKQAKEKLARAEERTTDKTERIRKASKGVCPYSGGALGSAGEIDHILPRSYSKSAFGAIFNSEMNLIYCTSEGNRKKADKHYRLENLHDNYLQAVFKTADRGEIRKLIQETLGKFDKNTPVYFSDLEPREQRDFRHALFDDELGRRVRPLLNAEYKMRVSGMQGYLARIIFQKLNEKNSESRRSLRFSVQGYGAEQIKPRRDNLESHNKSYTKPKDSTQAPGSHVIDATMIWAEALYRNDVPGLPEGLVLEGDALEELLPQNLQIRSLESRKQYRRKRPHTKTIFKDTIYAERYLSFIVTKKECGFGYDLKNMIKIPEELSEAIFELIKPFVQFRGELPKKSLSEYRTKLNASRKFFYFNVHRQTAAKVQQEIAHDEQPTPSQVNQQAILQGIRYFTQKKPVLNAMAGQGEKAVELPQKKLDEFSIKIDFNISTEGAKRGSKIAGIVNLPQRNAWEQVVSDKLVSSFVKTGKKWTELTDEQLNDFQERHFKQEIKNAKEHHGVRKVYSLPLMDGPSGGFRIHRKHGTEEHFQVQAKDGSTYAGLAPSLESADKADFSQPVIMPFLRKPGITPVEGQSGTAHKDIIYMDAWRRIPLNHVEDRLGSLLELCMAPNSDSRCRIRIKLQSNMLVKESPTWHLTAPLTFNIEKPNETGQIKAIEKKLGEILQKLALKPRDGKIQLYAVDHKSTTLEFVVQSTSSQQKDWYNAGTPL